MLPPSRCTNAVFIVLSSSIFGLIVSVPELDLLLEPSDRVRWNHDIGSQPLCSRHSTMVVGSIRCYSPIRERILSTAHYLSHCPQSATSRFKRQLTFPSWPVGKTTSSYQHCQQWRPRRNSKQSSFRHPRTPHQRTTSSMASINL